jgi:hypothetical protein
MYPVPYWEYSRVDTGRYCWAIRITGPVPVQTWQRMALGLMAIIDGFDEPR